MAGEGPERRSGGDFHGARIGAAAALTAVLVFLLVFGAVSPDYEGPSEVSLSILLGALLTLLGIDALSRIRR